MQARDRIGDRYELTYPIGRGGMGQVWAGYDDRLDRPVAVKFLRATEVPEAEREVAIKRFRREARVTARLDHPGVPVIHDLGGHGEDLYIVMQLVRGCQLADIVAEQERLSVADSASIAAQVCSVLTAAHAASLVHRDLKPQNLMVTPSGAVKVLDFGVAALIGPAEQSRLTATGHTLGTPAYIAPEQASAARVGPAADLYALGCILFEMLTGSPPFDARNSLEMLHRHLRSPIPIVTEYRSDVPDDLAHLLFCLLAKDPSDRPASAAEVEQLLLPYTRGSADVVTGRRTDQAAAAPTSPPRTVPSLPELRAQVEELAEHERFVQAAEMLDAALRSAPGEPGDELAPLRLDLANLYLLAGDFRRARQAFEELARDVSSSDKHRELADECRRNAIACQGELGEQTEP
ncbi:protein kinase [Micromonospora sp. PLK6-60]|uniref:serine/threonine-protein kinase n=1 Tax=Micromonospora sp. PLK6-60 TaxID=2873383 RepID=UPI001CA6B750|nr:serine/threonine-protein kinase [Micromonospora sp. PLK6-60]MBY8870478.1 protein kinase [Micromonospora sp. PLK6-60]